MRSCTMQQQPSIQLPAAPLPANPGSSTLCPRCPHCPPGRGWPVSELSRPSTPPLPRKYSRVWPARSAWHGREASGSRRVHARSREQAAASAPCTAASLRASAAHHPAVQFAAWRRRPTCEGVPHQPINHNVQPGPRLVERLLRRPDHLASRQLYAQGGGRGNRWGAQSAWQPGLALAPLCNWCRRPTVWPVGLAPHVRRAAFAS